MKNICKCKKRIKMNFQSFNQKALNLLKSTVKQSIFCFHAGINHNKIKLRLKEFEICPLLILRKDKWKSIKSKRLNLIR